MKREYFKIIMGAGIAVASLVSCTKKLDLIPTNDVTASRFIIRRRVTGQPWPKYMVHLPLPAIQEESAIRTFPRRSFRMKEIPISCACISTCRN